MNSGRTNLQKGDLIVLEAIFLKKKHKKTKDKMPKSWLYSENGILIQEKYINSVTENDIIVKNKSKLSLKPARKSKGNIILQQI